MFSPSNKAPEGGDQDPLANTVLPQTGHAHQGQNERVRPFSREKDHRPHRREEHGLILSAGDYARRPGRGGRREEGGEELRLGNQDEVEANLDFNTKWKQMRNVNQSKAYLAKPSLGNN